MHRTVTDMPWNPARSSTSSLRCRIGRGGGNATRHARRESHAPGSGAVTRIFFMGVPFAKTPQPGQEIPLSR